MKKLFQKLTFVAVAASVAFLYSCGGDEEFAVPVISFDPASGQTVEAGSTIELTVTVTAEGGFNVLRALGDQTKEYPRGDANVSLNEDNTQAQVTINIPVPTMVGDYYIDFEAVDDQDQVATNTFEFSVTSPAARSYAAFLLAAPLGEDPNVAGDQRNSLTFFSTNLGTRISAAEVVASEASSADVDFGFYYLQSTGLSLAAPASYPSAIYDLSATGQQWGTLNATKLRSTTLDAAAFAEITTFAAIDEAFNNGTEEAGMKGSLDVGMVLAFETDADKTGGSKRGLILVTGKTDANSNGDYWDQGDGIEIEVLVQEPAS